MSLISTLRNSAIICLFLHIIFKTCDSQVDNNKFNVTNSSPPTNITRLINLQEFLARYNMTRSSLKIPKSIEELNSQEMRKIKALQVKIQRLQQTIDNGNSEIQQRIGVLSRNQESLAIALANLQKEFQYIFNPGM